jgi:hypothetical protein
MCSELSFSKLHRFRVICGRNFYPESPLINLEPAYSLEVECKEIQTWIENLEPEVGSAPKAYQDKVWLPQNIATMARVRVSGRPFIDEIWQEYQKHRNYYLPEIVKLGIDLEIPIDQVKFFEEQRLDDLTRRLLPQTVPILGHDSLMKAYAQQAIPEV